MALTKKALILPVLITMISVLGFSAQNANALTTTVSDQQSCESAPVGGVWNSVTSTCTVATLVIGPGDTLVIASNVNFNIGSVTSSGVITNDGTINIASGGVITTSGTFNNNGNIASVDGTITNSGPFNDLGTITSSGTITNDPSGGITISGSMTGNGASSVIKSSGSITITSTGKLTNNGGKLTNTLNLVNHGLIYTTGTFTNSGPVTNTGYIKNLGLLTNSNTITNNGTIFNQCGGTVNNSGTISGNPIINTCGHSGPSAPQNLQATTGPGSVTLTWQTPSNNGGYPITGYKVYRSTSSGTETGYVSLGNVNTFTNTGLTGGTTYFYKVRAVNSVGISPLSIEASATPS